MTSLEAQAAWRSWELQGMETVFWGKTKLMPQSQYLLPGKVFWNPSFLLGSQYNGKITTDFIWCRLQSEGRVDTHLFPSTTAQYFERCYDASFLSEMQLMLAWHSQLWLIFQNNSVLIVNIMAGFSKDLSILSAKLLWKTPNNYLGEHIASESGCKSCLFLEILTNLKFSCSLYVICLYMFSAFELF